MAQSKASANVHHQYDDIQEVLLTQLKKLREQSPERFPKPIHVLAAVDDSVEDQLEQLLQQESKDHKGERIILIPYYLGNFHCIGILLEFQGDQQIKRTEYIDSVNSSHAIPDRLQNIFANVYPDVIMQKRDFLKHEDPRSSENLTVKNLITAAENNEGIQVIKPDMDQLQDQIKNDNHTSTYRTDQEQISWLNKDESNLTFITSIPEHGNELKLQKLQQRLCVGLSKRKIEDTTQLLEEIQEADKEVRNYEKQGRTEEATKEMKYLHELKELQQLNEEICSLRSFTIVSTKDDELKLRELEQKFISGLANWRIQNATELQVEVQEAEKRIKAYEKQGRMEEAKKETEFWSQLKELQQLNEEICRLKSVAFNSRSDDQLKLPELEQRLISGLANWKIQNVAELVEQIQKTEIKIKRCEKQGRTEMVEKETEFLRQLKELQRLQDNISSLQACGSISNNELNSTKTTTAKFSRNSGNKIISISTVERKEDILVNLRADLANMPSCAEKTIMELVLHFEERLIGDCTSSQKGDSVNLMLKQLHDQVKSQDLLSAEIRTNLQNLHITIQSDNHSSIACILTELLKKIRPLNVKEIQRLIVEAKKTAELIRNKEIILLVGETGTGKSTTIQFLAGSEMEEIRVEVVPGKFLEHITAVGTVKNSQLNNVNSSPLNKSETRYITPVTIPLKDIFGVQENGYITLCDAPGFGDTAGPEVDIANSVGIIEAIKRTKSVKLLVLSSYKSLGDRGQGIQRLAHILIKMVQNIEQRLDAIFYAFTKYPEKTDINALLVDIKRSKVDTDYTLQSDTAFMTVLSDMIEKSSKVAYKIDPVHDDPKFLIKQLKFVQGIQYPREVFQFSMSGETRASIENHVQRDKFCIIRAMKYKDIDLVLHYLNNLKTLHDLIKESFIGDAHQESVRFVSESISEYGTEVMDKFNRAFASRDGLKQEHVRDYITSVEYLHETQKMKEHLESLPILPESLMQNIKFQLKEKSLALANEDLHSNLVEIYLDNFCMLKQSFHELEKDYSESCKDFSNRFEVLVQSACKPISQNEFKHVAEIILNIHKCLPVLKNHLGEKVERKYIETVTLLLQNLDNLSEKAQRFLTKRCLIKTDAEILNNHMEILRSAKENSALQDRIYTYKDMLKKKTDTSEQHSRNLVFEENFKDLDEIYNNVIVKVVSYFGQINERIKKLLEIGGDNVLDDTQTLVDTMEALRTIPEIELKTANIYYSITDSIHAYMKQMQEAAEKLLEPIDYKTGITNYRRLAQSLSRLKGAEWINRVTPGVSASMVHRITEELVQHAHQLENQMLNIDLSLKYPDNICVAQEIVDKIQSMSVLEPTVPDLKKNRISIEQYFVQSIKRTFDLIDDTFNLQDKREYDTLHPAHIYLTNQNYPDINVLNREIDDLKARQKAEIEVEEEEKRKIESRLNTSISVLQKHTSFHVKNTQASDYLKKMGFQSINAVHEDIKKNKKFLADKLSLIQSKSTERNDSISRLESIRNENESLLRKHNTDSSEVMTLSQKKEQNSTKSINKTKQENTIVIDKCEKDKQQYDLSDGLDASTADAALMYINQCKKVSHFRVKEVADHIYTTSQKYISGYGNFLNREIDSKFNKTINIGDEECPFSHSQDLEISLQKLSSLNKYPRVFECINGAEKEGKWRREFRSYYRKLSVKTEEYKSHNAHRELGKQLLIAQALSFLDDFCGDALQKNGFEALYLKHQVGLMHDCQEAFKTVHQLVSTREYEQADAELSEIYKVTSNRKAITSIRQDLEKSLNKLMEDTINVVNELDGKFEREEDKKSQVEVIKKNIEKIQTAFNKQNITDLLAEKASSSLKSFKDKINQVLSRIYLKELDSIEFFVNTDSFRKAEQGMESFTRMQRELNGHCTSDSINKKATALSDRLKNIVSEILKRDDFADIKIYSIHQPKVFLANLNDAAERGYSKYNQAYASMFKKIKSIFTQTIEETRITSWSDRPAKISSLNNASNFLPEELQTLFKSKINELSDLVAQEKKAYRHELEKLLRSAEEDDKTITQIGELAQRYSSQNMDEFLEILREQIVSKLYIHRSNVESSFEQQNVQSAVDIVKKILKYKDALHIHISELEEICKSVRDLAIHGILKCSESLLYISTIEQTQVVEKAFSNIIVYINFSSSFDKRVAEFLPDNVLSDISERFQKMFKYFYKNSETYQVAMKEMSIVELDGAIKVSKKWNEFLQKIINCPSKHNLVQTLLKDIESVILYSDMISELQKKINHLKIQVNVDFINDDTTRFEIKRDEFFINLKKSINTLKEIYSKFNHILTLTVDMKKLEDELKKKVENIGTKLISYAARTEISSRDCDQFRMYYNHLLSFNKHVNLREVDARHFLEAAEEIIFEKITSLRQQSIVSGLNVEKISETVIKMKYFAENLSMFDSKINAEIDGALKIFKEKQGASGIMQLTMALEKTETGARLISDHSCLSGEDWRKRREKMQNQDNLNYALKELKGDDIDVVVLTARYKSFREKYEELVSNILRSFNRDSEAEPNIEVLVTQTKRLVGTSAHKNNSIIWNHTFKDKIPELLAHIFAVWTLKNTLHYNTAHDIDAARAYLLMPHVAQVIAIFRLLGVGYDSSIKIKGFKIPITGRIFDVFSDNLESNIVEIGTGEGKSVVLAIAACVFALAGLDVNCSCYSEVLSMRDKNDFASVFRALGIEERIRYGTFNKLCEQLLNEQCNVREKVRDMIVKNKSMLTVDTSKVCTGLKVLLIDEVDVFLSDKFYGGMYTPSVFLIDSSIKELLDTLWENRRVQHVSTVKNRPAYKTCATKYSNWILLFDEAIKDMLVALQSFQSSTYIVQNDKIVYIEGESIVDNVARGYDTIWAYYYEKEKGNISQSSLEANVGIIVNCGTFSYAEMPLEFAYIAGVTGTLRTLTGPEQNILQNVYGVRKNTFMPSVFGKANRTFNTNTDIHSVEKSEYFMRIRGEIDVVCNANRAILVFFESEEKLMAFYNSTHLSSIKQDVQMITEKVSVKDRELCIKRAATIHRVTLLTRIFGRGTDFVCRNQQLLANGGIHVLQTFFSEELSEEYQIMGRGARQGDRGSYRILLLDEDLEWVLGSAWKEELPKMFGTTFYEALNKARNARYESKCNSKELGIEQRRHDHKTAKTFMAALSAGSMETVRTFLSDQNRGANLVTVPSRTVLLMDATGSMSSLLTAAKETVCTMFERASAVLTAAGLPNDAFQMQFTVYRDYDCKEDGILQSSSWETKPSHLRSFMEKISAKGGGDYEEAIEIGLCHTVQQSEQPGGISQVIIIGDAPAKDKLAIEKDRKANGGESYWGKTKFKNPTHYKQELQKLKNKGIPVHAFYLTTGAKSNFEEIARETGGCCKHLHINSSKGAELLTTFVTEEVLRKTAGAQADAVVKLYREKYVKTTFIS